MAQTNWALLVVYAARLASAGPVSCWGTNTDYLITRARFAAAKLLPTPIPSVTAESIAMGTSSACTLTGSTLYCWGSLSDTSLAVAKFDMAANYICAISVSGDTHCWGTGPLGSVTSTSSTPLNITSAIGEKASAISTGLSHACVTTVTFRMFCWGQSSHLVAPSNTPIGVFHNISFVSVACGDSHTCGLTGTGNVYCWGDSSNGVLGSGAPWAGMVKYPVQVTPLPAAAVLKTGGNHNCVITTLSQMYCWGAGNFGQIKPTSLQIIPTPYRTDTSSDITVMALAYGSTCASGARSAMRCWGDNTAQMLGLPTTICTHNCQTVFVGRALACNQYSTCCGAEGIAPAPLPVPLPVPSPMPLLAPRPSTSVPATVRTPAPFPAVTPVLAASPSPSPAPSPTPSPVPSPAPVSRPAPQTKPRTRESVLTSIFEGLNGLGNPSALSTGIVCNVYAGDDNIILSPFGRLSSEYSYAFNIVLFLVLVGCSLGLDLARRLSGGVSWMVFDRAVQGIMYSSLRVALGLTPLQALWKRTLVPALGVVPVIALLVWRCGRVRSAVAGWTAVRGEPGEQVAGLPKAFAQMMHVYEWVDEDTDTATATATASEQSESQRNESNSSDYLDAQDAQLSQSGESNSSQDNESSEAKSGSKWPSWATMTRLWYYVFLRMAVTNILLITLSTVSLIICSPMVYTMMAVVVLWVAWILYKRPHNYTSALVLEVYSMTVCFLDMIPAAANMGLEGRKTFHICVIGLQFSHTIASIVWSFVLSKYTKDEQE